MRRFLQVSPLFGFFALAVMSASLSFFVACDEDTNTVRVKGDGGEDDAEGGSGVLSCGVVVPTEYVSLSFTPNTTGEVVLEQALFALDAKMKTAESATPAAVSAADLQAIWAGGAPSLRSVASAFGQSTIDTYLQQFGDFNAKTWNVTDPDADGGTTTGGRYANATVVSATGLSLRDATHAAVLNSSLYNYALGLASGPISASTIDRLLVVFGTTPAFNSLTDAGGVPDTLMAAYASQRDDKVSAASGVYRKARSSLLVALAAASDPDKCRTDLDSSLKFFFLQWETASYLTVIYALSQTATNALLVPQDPAKNAIALQSFAAAVGLAESFKGIPQDRRRITDAQIDALLDKIGANAASQVVTQASGRAVAFNSAYQDIGAIYGLTQTQIEDAKKAF